MAASKKTVEDELMEAIELGNVDQVRDCLNRGASPVFSQSICRRYRPDAGVIRATPILRALSNWSERTPEIIELLVKHKVPGQKEEVFSFRKLNEALETQDNQNVIYISLLDFLRQGFARVRGRDPGGRLTEIMQLRISELKKIIQCLVLGGFSLDKQKIDVTGTQFEVGLKNKKITLREFLSLPNKNDVYEMAKAFDAAEADRQELLGPAYARTLGALSSKTIDAGSGGKQPPIAPVSSVVSGFLRDSSSKENSEQRWAFLSESIHKLPKPQGLRQSAGRSGSRKPVSFSASIEDEEIASKPNDVSSSSASTSHTHNARLTAYENISRSAESEVKTTHEQTSAHKGSSHKKTKGKPKKKR